MDILGPTSNDDFVANFWQQKPLLIRQAIPAERLRVDALIDGDELAGLALEEDVESRLIRCDSGGNSWHCEDGPFADDYFSALPPSHWTLLVQGVDQHSSKVANLLGHFDFLPRWRLDDIMISYATDGGGVGPHFDLYDVFLLQIEGTRRWRLGQHCDQNTALRNDVPLKLLADFEQQEDFLLEAGDMLYLPGGVAHWGTAVGDACMTCSIGYRSPSTRAIVMHAMEALENQLTDVPSYQDTQASIDDDPFRINQAALTQVRAIWDNIKPQQISQALISALGTQVTEPRQADLIIDEDMLDPEQLSAQLSATNPLHLQHHAASRFAYFAAVNEDGEDQSEHCVLFVDGQHHAVSLTLAKGVCHCLISAQALQNDHDRAVLQQLLAQGSLRIR